MRSIEAEVKKLPAASKRLQTRPMPLVQLASLSYQQRTARAWASFRGPDFEGSLFFCGYCVLACLLAGLPACVLACMLACLHACMHACLLACLLACVFVYLCVCVCVCVCMLVCVFVCLQGPFMIYRSVHTQTAQKLEYRGRGLISQEGRGRGRTKAQPMAAVPPHPALP